MAKYLPIAVPSWLAGSYDNDKSVGRSANEAFIRVFSTEEKRANLWRIYTSSIIEYSRNVLIQESVATLSDERTTSPDDAYAKYSRVSGAAILMVNNLLGGSVCTMWCEVEC